MDVTTMTGAARPIKILIAAMGGEGGGVMTKWMTELGESQGYDVRYTYVPGVAQRTGATTYYVELFPHQGEAVAGRPMITALMPCPGDIDVLLSTEPVEAGRALQMGFVTGNRTFVISSTHRVFAVAEKAAPGDGRVDVAAILDALERYSRRFVRFDMAACAAETGSIINAVLFGALAGSGVLPFPREAFEAAIGGGQVANDSNQRGFDLGHAVAAGTASAVERKKATRVRTLSAAAQAAMENRFPSATHEVLRLGMRKLTEYQDAAYAERYLTRLDTVLAADRAAGGDGHGHALTRETGRWLARLMAYDDIIRVADLKTRRSRFDRVHEEVRADGRQIVRITDYLKPGIEELVSILPPALATRVLGLAERTGFAARGFPLTLKSSTISGFLSMRFVAGLRKRRPRSYRFAKEQARIESWLAAVLDAATRNYDAALEVAACARLIKGYGPTHCRGEANLEQVLAHAANADATAIRALREAALADDSGKAMVRSAQP